MKDGTITSSNGDLSSTSFNDGVQIGINRTDKKEHLVYKYSKELSIAEAVLVDNKPMFLQVKDDAPILNEKIETDDLILVPPIKFQYLSNGYVFSSIEEINGYIKRAEKETLDSLYTIVKEVWKKYFDIDDETLTLCAADTIFTYFQDKLGMTHYLLFVYRIIHYHDPIDDVDLSVKARDKQLCKPVLRLFKSTRAINEIVDSLSRFLYEKNNDKINSFDSYLYSIVAGLVKDNGNRISNETLGRLFVRFQVTKYLVNLNLFNQKNMDRYQRLK